MTTELVTNAVIESFHATLKKEEVNHVQYFDFHSAKLAMFQFIEGWYNRAKSDLQPFRLS